MQMRLPPGAVTIWLLASIVAALSCSLYFSAAHIGSNEYVPVGNDSFYHARRILDTVQDPSAFYEFDPKIHAPEGSLLTWPWGYDYLMAGIVRLGLALGLSDNPMAILIWIPVAAVFVSVGLLVLVGRRVGLSTWPLALTASCMALAPTTQFLHGTGLIDHHYAELIFVLATLAAGLKWLQQPQSRGAAATVAVILGVAPAIHNGLFILQLPLLVTLFIRWLLAIRQPATPAATLAVVLLVTTTAILIPSTAFREGRFEFYTLSWFHLYVAFCTATFAVLLSRLPRTPRTLAALLGIGFVLVLPIATQLDVASGFVAKSAKWLDSITEMKSPVKEALTAHNAGTVGRLYSLLIWLAPVTFLFSLLQCWRERNSERLLFWVSAVAGLVLLASQVRMHYFGDFALYMPWLILADSYARAHPTLYRKTFLVVTLSLLVLYIPAVRQLVAPVPRANDHTFEDTRPMFSVLRQACAEDPGIVLADANAGHYIRYYTDCSVLIDNFLLTPQHFRKMDEAERLFNLSARDLVSASPQIKYVLVRPLDIKPAADAKHGYMYWLFLPGNPALIHELLLGPIQNVPSQYELLDEIKLPGPERLLYARLYKIRRDSAASATQASVKDGSK